MMTAMERSISPYEERGSEADGTGSKGDTGGKGSNEKENWKEEPKKKKWVEQMANNMDNYEMCGKIRVA